MPEKNIKVLQILVCLGGGGVETLLLNLQKKLPEHITFDYLVAYSDVRDKDALALGSTVHVMPPEMQRPTHWADFVKQLVREHRYDVVHFHRFAFGGNVLQAAKQAVAKIRIAHSHHTLLQEDSLLKKLLYYPYHWTINRWKLSRYATHIVGCSSDALRFLMGKNSKSNPKCRVILNGIPIETFVEKIGATPKAELCQRYGIPAKTPVIGNFGRLDPVKNHEHLLHLFEHGLLLQIFDTILTRHNLTASQAAAQPKPPVLFIGGEGALRSKLEHERDQFSLQDRVFMPGHCTNAPELLGNMFDCFVLPSHAEGLPVSVIEAVAAGLYVVCSDTVTKDITGAFPDRITALPLSAPLETWAEAIEQAIQQRSPPRQGLELVRNSPMNFEHFAEEVVKIYENVSEPPS
jgi:glycosyltransferase involved in cell wall biosynthesis